MGGHEQPLVPILEVRGKHGHMLEPEDFMVAVEKDPTMTPEDRRRWLDAVTAEQS